MYFQSFSKFQLWGKFAIWGSEFISHNNCLTTKPECDVSWNTLDLGESEENLALEGNRRQHHLRYQGTTVMEHRKEKVTLFY